MTRRTGAPVSGSVVSGGSSTARYGIAADLQIRLELKVLEVGRDYLLAPREDETGMQVLVAYRLLRGTES
ncbi:MAG: hypothetical protein KatS3mg081_0315 [Gemmatimonadales bacterium]|nr:MAG: hypothetical protein KatS3mg081_0315 [Gemmatimonadales bacterium]